MVILLDSFLEIQHVFSISQTHDTKKQIERKLNPIYSTVQHRLKLSLSHLLPIKRSNCWATRGRLKLWTRKVKARNLFEKYFTLTGNPFSTLMFHIYWRSTEPGKNQFLRRFNTISGCLPFFQWKATSCDASIWHRICLLKANLFVYSCLMVVILTNEFDFKIGRESRRLKSHRFTGWCRWINSKFPFKLEFALKTFLFSIKRKLNERVRVQAFRIVRHAMFFLNIGKFRTLFNEVICKTK